MKNTSNLVVVIISVIFLSFALGFIAKTFVDNISATTSNSSYGVVMQITDDKIWLANMTNCDFFSIDNYGRIFTENNEPYQLKKGDFVEVDSATVIATNDEFQVNLIVYDLFDQYLANTTEPASN